MRRSLVPALLVAMGLSGIQAASGAVLRGTSGPDRLTGTFRSDELYGLAGNDRLEGRAATDLLDGGSGRDWISGGQGPDRINSSGDIQADSVFCGGARDIVTADVGDRVAADCETVSRQLSRDTGTSWEGQHETQVEPHSFAYGSTIVAVFQTGRLLTGGAVNNGFSTSKNGGRTWRSGLLPTGSSVRVSDPVVAYDAVHKWWLAASLGLSFDSNEIIVNRSRDGLSWMPPVDAARSSTQDYDKEWIVCDNWATSRFRGRCYISYMNFTSDTIETRRSTNGGLTWSAPVSIDANRRPAGINGVQPVVRPNGNLVLLFSVFGGITGNEIGTARSTDGGASFSAPVAISELTGSDISWLRAPPFVSADVDAGGTVYAAWRGCSPYDDCSADIVLGISRDGVTWDDPVRIPTGEYGGYSFLPALAVDPATSGRRARLALLFHTMIPWPVCDPESGCVAVDVKMTLSNDGGETWSRPRRLNTFSMQPRWMAETSLGRMLGDYVSVSWLRGRPVPVYSLAFEPSGYLYRQSIFAATTIR